mgnify:CR=1 FL=1|jgi:hypothetical protein|tara:strand:- start:1892 stop:2221 length:330 start_codon:yes stop_codon:yes gene_type:complete
MKKRITVNIDSTYKHLQLWNGIFDLTSTELKTLSSFIDVQAITKDENLCSMDNKKEVARSLGIKDPNTLNNYIKKFKDKRVITKFGGNYLLNQLLDINAKSIEININRI